jgi:hypothetical protein
VKARYAAATILIYCLSARRSNTVYYAAGAPSVPDRHLRCDHGGMSEITRLKHARPVGRGRSAAKNSLGYRALRLLHSTSTCSNPAAK